MPSFSKKGLLTKSTAKYIGKLQKNSKLPVSSSPNPWLKDTSRIPSHLMRQHYSIRKKKNGKLRPIMDYRILNKWTVRDNYPLPLIVMTLT